MCVIYIKSENRCRQITNFMFLDGIMGGQDTDFGELFGNLRAMKEHAASLPMSERRIVAEQVVIAYWKAMLGDLEMED